MSKSVEEIEHDVARLSPEQLRKFRAWFAEFDALAWDEQIERDVASGGLDHLADEALEDHRSGRSTRL